VEPEPPIDRLAALERALSEAPLTAPFVPLAEAHLALGHEARALEILKQGIAARPEEPGALTLLARVELARGRPKSAIRHAAAALRQAPSDVAAMKTLGRALIETAQDDEAWVVLERACKTAPEDEEARALLRETAAGTQRRALAEAPEIGVVEPTGRVETLLKAPLPKATPAQQSPSGFTAYIQRISVVPPTQPVSDASPAPQVGGTQPRVRDLPSLADRPPHPGTGRRTLDADSPAAVVALATTDQTEEMPSPGLAAEQARSAAVMPTPAVAPRPTAGPRIALPLFDFEAGLSPGPVAAPTERDQPVPTVAHVVADMAEDAALGTVRLEKKRAGLSEAAMVSPRFSIPGDFEVSLSTSESSAPFEAEPTAGDVVRTEVNDDLEPTTAEAPAAVSDRDSILDESARPARPPTQPLLAARTSVPEPPESPPILPSAEAASPVKAAPTLPSAPPHAPESPRPQSVPARAEWAPRSAPSAPPSAKPAPPPLPVQPTGTPTRKRPGTPRATPGLQDLLDIPLDPAEFDGLRAPAAPPRPTAQPAPRPTAQPAPPAAQPAPPTPKPGPSIVAVAAPPPPPETSEPPRYDAAFGSYFDARTGHRTQVPDAVADIVAAQRRRAPAQSSTSLGAGAALSMVTPRARRALGLTAVVVLTLGFIASWRYVSQATRLDAVVESASARLAEATPPARRAASDTVGAGVEEVDLAARAASGLFETFGAQGLGHRRRVVLALRARLEAERVARDADEARRAISDQALMGATAHAANEPDTALAEAWKRLEAGDFAATRRAADRALTLRRDDADAHWLWGQAALAEGLREPATERLGAAQRSAPDHVGVALTVAEARIARGQYGLAYEGMQRLMDGPAASSVDARIGYARIRITLEKRQDDAAAELRSLLAQGGLSPKQTALAQEALGRYALARGDAASARAAFEQAARAAPRDPRFAANVAALDLREYKLDAAERVLVEAARMHPEEPQHAEYLARARLARGDARGALTVLDRIGRKTAQTLMLQGRAYIETGQFSQAERVLDDAATLDAKHFEVRVYRALARWMLQRTSIRKDELKRLRDGPGSQDQIEDPALRFRALAEALLAEGNAAEAIASFKNALVVDTRDALAKAGLCRAFALAGSPDLARRACAEALAINPAYMPAADQLAAFAEAEQDPQAVIATLAERAVHDPQPPSAVRRLARAHVTTMSLEAAAALAQAAEKSGDPASARYIEGLLALREERAEDALRAMTPLTEAVPDAIDVRLDAGRAYALAEQWDAARRALSAAAAQTHSPAAPLAAARVWLAAGRADLALAAAQDAEERARTTGSSGRALAVVLATRAEAAAMLGGPSAAARDAANEALRLAPHLALAHRVAGQLALASGQTEAAFKFLRRAVDLEAYSAESLYALGRAQLSTREFQSAGRATLARAHRIDANGRFGRLAARALGQ